MGGKLRSLFVVLVLIIVVISFAAISLRSTDGYVLGAKSDQEDVSNIARFWRSFLKVLGLYRTSEPEAVRSFEYVNVDKLRDAEDAGERSVSLSSPSPSATPNVGSNLPPLPPLPL